MRSTFFGRAESVSTLDVTVNWNASLTEAVIEKITRIHTESFLDLYKNFSEQQLGLPEGLTKEKWLGDMIAEDLAEIQKGNIEYVGAYLNGELLGFATCDRACPRYSLAKNVTATSEEQEFKNDVYIRLLAVLPCKYLITHYAGGHLVTNHPEFIKQQIATGSLPENMRTGIGRLLVDSMNSHFTDATTLTLDTRRINTNGVGFYTHIGFNPLSAPLGGSNPTHYIGLERDFVKSGVVADLRRTM